MKTYLSTLKLPGSPIGPESVLPILRDLSEHKTLESDESLSESLKDTLGAYCGYRVLPYKLQNHYNRDKVEMTLKTIILENDILKATFLPSYGGRLYALYNKVLKKELISVNPVFQPGNLGLRNAWFSGGIEWNMAHFGHTYLSSDDVHFGQLTDENGESFLRLYEYERTKQLYYQIDFHLPKGSDHLITYTKIFNLNKTPSPLYYWSNVAVSEMKNARVFSSTDQVMYIKPYWNEQGEMVNTFASGKVPNLEGIEGDVSYPRNFKRSNEYFYQTDPKTLYPWEAVGYEDGFLFYECSSKILNYRKMFCWGTHQGGTKWQEYLSTPENDKYVEIQAGIFPSQLHSELLPGKSEKGFMQIFGGIEVDKEALYQDLDLSSVYVEDHIYKKHKEMANLESHLCNLSDQPVENVLHHGKSFAWLESERLKKENLVFPIQSMCFDAPNKRHYLKDVLDGNPVSIDLKNTAIDYIIDPKWLIYLERYDEEFSDLLQGLIHAEQNMLELAKTFLISRVKIDYSSLYFRTIAVLLVKMKLNDEAKTYFDRAYKMMEEMTLPYYKEDFLAEYLHFLYEQGDYEYAWQLFSLHEMKHEEMYMEGAKLAYKLGKYDVLETLLNLPLERIREGNNTMVELWYQWMAVKNKLTLDEARQLKTPTNIDFRML